MYERCLKTAEEWLTSPYDKATQEKVLALIKKGGEELIESFYKELDFGTGGMRGVMGVGPNRINKYTIGKATQGLANTLISLYEGQDVSVAIAYDCRNNSNKLAQNAAEVLTANGIKAYLFNSLRPTPELSFAVRELGCKGGLVITASHNPKEYNGFKVYGADGAQIISPFDTELINKVRALSINEVNFSVNKESKFYNLIFTSRILDIFSILQNKQDEFNYLEVPIQKKGKVFDFDHAIMLGGTVAFSFKGEANPSEKTASVNGTYGPLYLFEKNFQNFLFLKELFGKNIEESLIAADFKILKNGNKTDFVFNPLSVLTPGKTRNFFDTWE